LFTPTCGSLGRTWVGNIEGARSAALSLDRLQICFWAYWRTRS
jgi:hypothetical protein